MPRRVYHVDPTTEQQCVGTIKTFFAEDCVSEDDNNFYFNTYTQYYDQQCKKNCFTPAPISIPKTHPKANGFAKLLSKADGEEVREFGVNVIYINGAQKVEITEDMLSDEQKELLEMNMITMDDIRRELGDTVYGDRKTETRAEAIARGYTSGSKETVYNASDLVAIPSKDEPKEEEVDIDIFDEDDEEIIPTNAGIPKREEAEDVYAAEEDYDEEDYDALDDIIMLGYPFGVSRFDNVSTNLGKIVSYQNRQDGPDFINIDLSAKSGNSGSGVLNLQAGYAIGVLCGGNLSHNGSLVEEVNYCRPISYVWDLIERNQEQKDENKGE